jgi:hypothetical protein
MAFSLSSAFADPVQIQEAAFEAVQSPRSGGRAANVRAIAPAPQGVRGAAGNSKSAQAPKTSGKSAASVARPTAAAASAATAAPAGAAVSRQRNVASRTNRTVVAAQQATRSVRNRAAVVAAPRQSRAVVSRSGTQQARVGLTGSAIRASTSTPSSSLTTKLSSATYSNLIDPTTGMLSADSYSNCMESYYACMDEICTARSPGQRRCACAGRVKTFNTVEATLQTAKEDLLKVSGELSLLIATKGESIHSAFELTDAEKSLNCVSFRDEKKRQAGSSSSTSMKAWCDAHLMLDTPACETSMSAVCNQLYGQGTGNDWMSILNGADSDILTSLQTYANTINEVNTFSYSDDDNLFTAWNNVDLVVNGSSSIFDSENSVDRLAKTWGYELFQYAHNNVCGRVLDSCFNGIYEMCGNRPTEQGGGTGPYNQNSDITVSNDGNDIEFVTPKSSASNAGSATCYGYANSSGDPYSTLRRPIADARLSILQKYVLDSNADCDTYGEELKKQAQNMAYQKIAATQLLQKKRLEFAQEKETAKTDALVRAKEKFAACVSEVYDCYDQQTKSSASWTVARIKNYCSQNSEVPSCYDDMVCDRDAREIVDASDSDTCRYSAVVGENTCRNLVLLNEIINKTGEAPANTNIGTGKSRAFREFCLTNTPGVDGTGSIRKFGEDWGPGL